MSGRKQQLLIYKFQREVKTIEETEVVIEDTGNPYMNDETANDIAYERYSDDWYTVYSDVGEIYMSDMEIEDYVPDVDKD